MPNPPAPTARGPYQVSILHDASGYPAQPLQFAAIDIATAGDNVIVAAQAGLSVYICGLLLVVANSNTTPRLKDGAAANLSGAFPFAANGGIAAPVVLPPAAWAKTSPGNAFIINLATSTQCSGLLAYFTGP